MEKEEELENKNSEDLILFQCEIFERETFVSFPSLFFAHDFFLSSLCNFSFFFLSSDFFLSFLSPSIPFALHSSFSHRKTIIERMEGIINPFFSFSVTHFLFLFPNSFSNWNSLCSFHSLSRITSKVNQVRWSVPKGEKETRRKYKK